MKYKILFDYRSEGYKFYDDKEFETVAETVDFAVKLNYGVPFLIVKVFDWEAVEKKIT